jgi:hypothetical protein
MSCGYKKSIKSSKITLKLNRSISTRKAFIHLMLISEMNDMGNLVEKITYDVHF